MSKHTAGKWKQGRSPEQVFAGGSIVADCMWIDRPTNECKANARLIASAPELLEALRKTTEQLRVYLAGVEDGKDDDAESAYQYGCAIIAKAEGVAL